MEEVRGAGRFYKSGGTSSTNKRARRDRAKPKQGRLDRKPQAAPIPPGPRLFLNKKCYSVFAGEFIKFLNPFIINIF